MQRLQKQPAGRVWKSESNFSQRKGEKAECFTKKQWQSISERGDEDPDNDYHNTKKVQFSQRKIAVLADLIN